MAKPKTKIYELLRLIREHGPVSPNRLTELSGDLRQSIDKYIREAHDSKLIHIAGFAPSPLGGNRTVKLYSFGKGVDAVRNGSVKREKKAKEIAPNSRRYKDFSAAEKRILREIKASGKTVKSQLHLLPGRTFYGVERAISNLKGTKKRGETSWIWPAVVSLLKETPDLTSAEISEHIGCTKRQVQAFIKTKGVGPDRSIYVSSWQRRPGAFIRRWSFGDAEDAPKPAVKTPEEELRAARLRHHMRRVRSSPFAVAMNQIMREAA